jgi:hypothetical protein
MMFSTCSGTAKQKPPAIMFILAMARCEGYQGKINHPAE